MLELEGKINMEEMCFNHFLKMGKDSAALHQMGTVNEKVCESDFVPLWDDAIIRFLSTVFYNVLEATKVRFD